ncbi:SLAC1 anion channel family protein [Sulfurospirillum sp. 1612]|uniref:SLAC1 anion channel family protein n=1 Tax=Sulfurospirillum sp. 1612 TaxID=3094835 RepID=UPI002F93F0EB
MKTSARLENFPIMMFAITMGLSGLSIAYQKAAHLFHCSSLIPSILVALTTITFIAISLTYATKFIMYRQEVKKEFTHPVRVNFFAAFSITLLLMSIMYQELNTTASVALWWVGMVLQAFLTFYTISFWINHSLEIQHSNPAWFIPIVGNVVVPIGGIGIVNHNFLMYFFSIGILFWIILFTIILNRIIFHNQLAKKFMPTLFIFIAPPAVGVISYVKLTGHFDLFASFLFNIGLFFTFLLVFMYKNFMKLEFFISWWAFTFPLTAMTIATILSYHTTKSPFCYYLAIGLLIVSTIVVSFVAYKTICHMLKKEICVIE